MTNEQLWQATLGELELLISKANFTTWFKSTFISTSENNKVIIGENVNIGKGTTIEPFVFIDHDAQIGDNCILKSGVRICSNVLIGNQTIIGQNSVIGGPGFGIEKKEEYLKGFGED